MQEVEIVGERAQDLADILRARGWQGSGALLQREGEDLQMAVSCGELLPGLLPLGRDPAKAAQILRWFTDWEVRRAESSDLTEMCNLKAERIQQTFLFLSEARREREIAAVATEEHMAKEMAANDFWVCRRHGKLWALGGLRETSPDEGLLYSGYSRGDRAGAALLALLIREGERRGYKRLRSNLYDKNQQSPGHLRYQGFRLSNNIWTSRNNPPHRVRSWMLYI